MYGDQIMKINWGSGAKLLLAIILIFSFSSASSAICSVSTRNINFGSYDVFNNSSTESTGNIIVSCDSSAGYTISLSTGGGTFLNRVLSFGSYLLNYNLYIDPARSNVWGDGSGGTLMVSSVTLTTSNHIVYGRIPARQNAFPGNYMDNVNVTISF